MNEYLSSFMILEGFTPVNTNLNQFSIFLKKEAGYVTAVFSYEINSAESVDEVWYARLRENAMESLKQAQFPEIHPLFLLISGNVERAANACMQDRYAWVIDPVSRTLIIPQGHAEDFYGLKGRLNLFLQDPAKARITIGELQKQYQNRIEQTRKEQNRSYASTFPWVSVAIAVINLIFVGLSFLYGDSFTDRFDLDPVKILGSGQWYRLFTYMYLHAGMTHYINNMVMLYVEGNAIEAGIGRWKYLLFYHVLGVFAGFGSLLFKYYTGSIVPTVGASGAIMGVMGILLYITIRNFRTFRRSGSRIFMLALCGVDSLYQGFYMKGVDNAAHVAGMIGGVIIGIIWDANMRRKSTRQQINRRD